MDTLTYKTVSANAKTVNKEWVLLDAEDQVVGRFASEAAKILRGKHKTNYTPHVDCGDNVIIINAEKIKFSGKKMNEKEYITYSGYPGGQYKTTPEKMLATKPDGVLRKAIHGMLPTTKLANAIKKNLFIYAGPNHPHEAQKPKQVKFK
ncbi:MAG: 50S ribosomal protein L13 [Bacteroidota bacterium]